MRSPVLLTTVLSLCALGCSSSTPAKPPETKVENPINDAARFLAGMEGRAGGVFRELEGAEAWKAHAAEVQKLWERFERAYLDPARQFQKSELAPAIQYSDTVFYPFSGPDVPFMLAFFPAGKTYVMAGLEPVGPIPAPELYPAEQLEKSLGGLRAAGGDMFGRSFFVTREMDQQFRGQVARGVLPMLLMLLAKTGCQVESARHVQIEPDGTLLEHRGPDRPRGVEIEFRRPDGGSAKLYYFSTDLAKGLETDPRFLRFLNRFPSPDTLVKSGSFLLHWRMCERLRNFILEKSRNVLQDDTGVPYHYYVKTGWNVRLYGEYTVPDPPFRRQYQKDLAAAFEEPGKAKPLGFSLGYGARRRPTALIFASRPADAANGNNERKAAVQ